MNIHQRYVLKPSRIALGFQLLSILAIFILLSTLLNVWWCIFLLCIALLSLKIFRMQAQAKVLCLEYLEHDVWSLKYENSQIIQTIRVKKILNHSLYSVINFEDVKAKNLIIWCDQLSKEQWKSMQARSRLN